MTSESFLSTWGICFFDDTTTANTNTTLRSHNGGEGEGYSSFKRNAFMSTFLYYSS
jgi:hypothetical protein